MTCFTLLIAKAGLFADGHKASRFVFTVSFVREILHNGFFVDRNLAQIFFSRDTDRKQSGRQTTRQTVSNRETEGKKYVGIDEQNRQQVSNG